MTDFLAMARSMKAQNDEFLAAINKVTADNWGVVEARWDGERFVLSISDEEHDPNVRIYPGE